MSEKTWWQQGIIYEIYIRSFQDTNHDGTGDLRGITERIGYLKWLGVDAVWITPFYPSPMADFGYDITDYENVDPVFGTMEDFDDLIRTAHSAGLKVIMDFVPNHTSNEHPWFIQSRSSRENARRNWYVWHDPGPDGGPPNNWLANFGGSAWTFDQRTGQYYYHAFLPEQPDLNWRNPEVRKAMFNIIRFWFDRGIDGFRVDALYYLVEDAAFRDNPPNPDHIPSDGPYFALEQKYTKDQPEVLEVVTLMRRIFDEYDQRVMIGELYLPLERLVAYYGVNGSGAHLPFNFSLIRLPWDAELIKHTVDTYEALLPSDGWPNWVLGNHDKHRVASRIGRMQARVAAMILLTSRGTPTMYYGDEIAMCDVPVPPRFIRDPFEKNVPGLGFGRDPERTPMQWNKGLYAGFSDVQPWLPVAEDYGQYNVESQTGDTYSMLSLYRRLISLRRAEKPLSIGDYGPLASEKPLFAYLRKHNRRRLLIVLNLGHEAHSYAMSHMKGKILLTTFLDREGEEAGSDLHIRANEGIILALHDAQAGIHPETAVIP